MNISNGDSTKFAKEIENEYLIFGNTNYRFSQETIKDYREKAGSYSKDDIKIFKCDADLGSKKATDLSFNLTEEGEFKAGSKEIGQFLYMDVGRWGGDGKPGEEETALTWPRSRNFGLVCGSGVILCSYDNPNDKSGKVIFGDTPSEVKEHPDIMKMVPILNKLSESKTLGPVNVVKALICANAGSEGTSSEKIFVFLGDIHAPIMNSSDRINLDYVKIIDKKEAWTRGRIDLDLELVNELYYKMFSRFNLVTPASDGINEFVKESDKIDLISEWERILDIFKIQRLDNNWNNETISCEKAFDWFKLYHGNGKNKGGDIFQNAGEDLFEFITLFSDYQKNNQGQGSIPVELVQLGDLYDFWLGLKRAFDAKDPKKMNPDTGKFLKFWQNETLINTSAGKAISLLVNPANELKHTFVYGNHDRYRGTDQWPDNEKALDHFESTGIWAEHGHQSDVFNQDKNAAIGWSFALFGFFLPESRDWEGPLRKLEEGLLPGMLCRRLTCILHATETCQQENNRKQVYVMGHTHEPLLKKVCVIE